MPGLPLLQVGVAAGLTALPQLSGGVPKGYLRLLVFNTDSVLVGQQVQALTSAALNNYQALRLQLVVPQDGYVTAYVGNESEVDVLFDDVSVELRQGLQVQETQYDPAGLELAGLGGTTPGLKRLSQYKFNGKEFQADLGLNWNHQDWRFFDPQLLRWHVVDPEVENGQESMSPYVFGFDNAVRYADADGRCPGGCPPVPVPTLGALWEEGLQVAQEFGPFAQQAAVVITVGLAINALAQASTEAGGTNTGSLGTIGLIPLPNKADYPSTPRSNARSSTPTTSAKTENGIVTARPAKRTSDNSHGNKLNDKPAEGYTLRDRKTGDVKKYGETTQGEGKHGAGNQKRYSKKELKSNDVDYQVEKTGTKKEMHQWQTEKIREYKDSNNGQRPPLNKSDY